MCIAAPGKVLETDGSIAKVDVFGNLLEVNSLLVNAAVGDYVLIHAGCIIEIVSKESAEELQQLFYELEELENEEAK